MNKILVIGSSNTDLIAMVDRFPAAGETIKGKYFMQATGGKGANQALAAHRLGGNVRFVTCLGNDANGKNALQYYTEQGLDTSLSLQINEAATGTAIILVNDEGENIIVITPGANDKLSPEYVTTLENEVAMSSMIMLQMEIPLETVIKVCELARTHQRPVLLNVAPAKAIGPDLVKLIDILVVNETEIETISSMQLDTAGEDAVINKLLAMGAKTVILTLGKRGCVVKSAEHQYFCPAFDVETVDTTAAGDTFCGALVAKLSRNERLPEAVKFATAAAAICVTRAGAQPSIPNEEEVKNFLLTHKPFATRRTVDTNGQQKN